MKIFFDTEFTGLHKNTTLISIGLVTENGDTFYAELNDYNKDEVNPWIQQNVINNLIGISGNDTIVGNKAHVREELHKWLYQFDKIEWVSDVCHYDFVLLIDLLFNNALDMPYGLWNSACHDINQDIASYLSISEIDAFDYSREKILSDAGIFIEGSKHNALYDAKVIKELYKLCKTK